MTDAYFNLYIDNRGFLGLEVRNHGETRYVNLQGPAEVTRNTRHIMALSADPQEGYKFYFDGDMVFQMPVALYELWEYDYRFMSTVNSADVAIWVQPIGTGIRISLLRHHRQRACL